MEDFKDKILTGDSRLLLNQLPEKSYYTCITSPPYFGLRDYGCDGQIGQEKTLDEYIENIVEVCRGVRRTLRDDGTLWLNLGDTYVSAASDHRYNIGLGKHSDVANGIPRVGRAERNKSLIGSGLKPKDLIGVPWRVAFALQADGWYLRSDIIWDKPNPMPESVQDRPTKAHEYLFLLSKSEHYYYDKDAIVEPVSGATLKRLSQDLESQHGSERAHAGGKTNGMMKAVGNASTRNKRTVWTVPKKPFKGAHFATFPPELIEPCILAGCPKGEMVLDPFFGSGTTGRVAKKLGRFYTGIELNPDYVSLAERMMPKQLSLLI